jgi:hypothetical protein
MFQPSFNNKPSSSGEKISTPPTPLSETSFDLSNHEKISIDLNFSEKEILEIQLHSVLNIVVQMKSVSAMV